MVGDATQPLFTDAERGALGQFRHQYFLSALIVHMHKAALLMLSNRMVRTVTNLDTERPETVLRFRTEISGEFSQIHPSPLVSGVVQSGPGATCEKRGAARYLAKKALKSSPLKYGIGSFLDIGVFSSLN